MAFSLYHKFSTGRSTEVLLVLDGEVADEIGGNLSRNNRELGSTRPALDIGQERSENNLENSSTDLILYKIIGDALGRGCLVPYT